MSDVAGPEPDVIPPTEKGEHAQKELVESPGFEGCAVHQLMTSRTAHKGAYRAVGEQSQEQQRDRPKPGGTIDLEK